MPQLTREEREHLIHKAALLLSPMLLMPALGIWFFLSIPADSREWILGGSVAMLLFFTLGVGSSAMIGAYAFFGLIRHRLYVNGASATLLLALAFLATAGGEFVREGARKPYTIREYLYSTSITEDEVGRLREIGCLANDPYPLKSDDQLPNEQLNRGARVFRRLCSICHTVEGSNGLHHLTATWSVDQMRLNIAKLQRTKPFMPPFAGTPSELESLVQWLRWHNAGRPDEWEISDDAAVLDQIEKWLNEVGTTPGSQLANVHGGTKP